MNALIGMHYFIWQVSDMTDEEEERVREESNKMNVTLHVLSERLSRLKQIASEKYRAFSASLFQCNRLSVLLDK